MNIPDFEDIQFEGSEFDKPDHAAYKKTNDFP